MLRFPVNGLVTEDHLRGRLPMRPMVVAIDRLGDLLAG
jgi:hypothetical protein